MNSSRLPPTPLKPNKRKIPVPSSPSIATQTPDKPSSTRLRNRHVAFSLKEVRKVAQGDRDGQRKKQAETGTGRSARKLLAFQKEDSAASGGSAQTGTAKMDEKYEMLCEFFDNLDSSIRLLRLKGSMCSFANICSKIECLTDRRFTRRHLAQLKYVMPEVIELKKVLVFDERTSCMKPDLHVSMNVDAVECDEKSKSKSKNMHLRKVFRARLADFVSAHPEGDEVPEELLLEPFNHSKSPLKPELKKHLTASSPVNDAHVSQIHESSSSEPLAENHQLAMPSHFARSFKKHFSTKIAIEKGESGQQNTPNVHQSDISASECHQEIFFNKSNGNTARTKASPRLAENEQSSVPCASLSGVPLPCFAGTPIKGTNTETEDDSSAVQSTPTKFCPASSELMSTTPAMPPQKRFYMTPDDDSTGSKIKLVRRATRTRSLKFQDPIESDASDDDDILKILDGSLLESIREKERKAKEEQDPAISQAKRRRQMIACLPKLFNMIHFLFRSMQKSVITKEELLHKIIAGHLDVVDRREVEEQLNLLLELVPEWISEKLASTGDFLLRINKMSNAEIIRAQLEVAK